MTRNAWLFLIGEGLLAAAIGVIAPTFALYFRFFGVSLFELALLAAIFEATILIAEIPTGIFADRVGRKVAVCLGFAFLAGSGLLFVRFTSLAGFICGEISMGLGEAFISGAAEALAVESVRDDSRGNGLERLFVVRSRVRITVMSLAMATAGFLYTAEPRLVFGMLLAVGVAGFVVALLYRRSAGGSAAKPHANLRAYGGALSRLWRTSPVVGFIVLTALLAAFGFEAVDQYWQVLFGEVYAANIEYFGFYTAIAALLAFGLVGPVTRRLAGNMATIPVFLLLSGFLIFLLPLAGLTVGLFVLVIIFVARDLLEPLWSIPLNRALDDSFRATALSGFNLARSGGEVAAGLAVGLLAGFFGVRLVFTFAGTILVPALGLAVLYFRHRAAEV
jgi:MFS family permease